VNNVTRLLTNARRRYYIAQSRFVSLINPCRRICIFDFQFCTLGGVSLVIFNVELFTGVAE